MHALAPLEWSSLLVTCVASTLAGLGMYFAAGLFFERRYYRHEDQADAWKCQPRRWSSPAMRRREVALGTANLAAASLASGVLVDWIRRGGETKLYFSLAEHGLAFTAVSGVAYLLGADLALYWAHRLYHTKPLFRAIHRVHHRWLAPTSYTSMAMHPVEMATYQAISIAPIFLWPIHAGVVIAVLLVTNYYALVDHSGVKLWSWLPFVAPSQFHDDHHACFHVNYGQSFALWDRMFGTARRVGRKYGAEVFGGKGAAAGAEDADVRLWDYARPKDGAAAARTNASEAGA